MATHSPYSVTDFMENSAYRPENRRFLFPAPSLMDPIYTTLLPPGEMVGGRPDIGGLP